MRDKEKKEYTCHNLYAIYHISMKQLLLQHKWFLLVIVFLFLQVSTTQAAYNHELGLSGGTAFYLGDANHVTPFNRPGWTAGAFYRYNIDTRWAVKASVKYAVVQGDTRDFGYVFPNGQAYATFQRGFVDATATVEFNFLDIGESKYYKGRYKATPYILLGIGLTTYSDMYANGNAYKCNIPFGIGGKWRIDKRWTLGLEWTIHKLFIDTFDVTNANNQVLNNPYQAEKVGFFDTDFYSIANLYISFTLFDTNKFCR